jgi:hypothetical protein
MAQVRKYVYLDEDRDADILDWLSEQPRQSAAIKAALCAWVRDGQQENDSGVVDYGIFRQIVEAALDTKLSSLSMAPHDPHDNNDEDECEAMIDELGENVLM